MIARIGTLVLPAAVAALLLTGAVQVGRAAPPQEFIDACQDDALRVCHDEAMSQNDARISRCMRAHRRLVSKRCLVMARKYKRL
jgi:hypothetical protein